MIEARCRVAHRAFLLSVVEGERLPPAAPNVFPPVRGRRPGVLSLLALGAGSTATQVVVVREILGGFGGNELLGVAALGLWLLTTGGGCLVAGAWLDRRPRDSADTPRGMIAGHLSLALLPFAMLGAFRALPGLLDVRGSLPGVLPSIAGCLLVFLPYGLLSGAMIPLAARRAAEHHRAESRTAYLLDGIGCAVGGAILCLLLLLRLSHGWVLFTFSLPHAAAAGLIASSGLATPTRVRRMAGLVQIAFVSAFLVPALAGAFFVDRGSLGFRFPGQTIVAFKQTPFGQLAVTRTGHQVNLLQDGLPLHSSDDLGVEARTHPGMCQVAEGSVVLLVGGTISGGAREVMRHRPSRLDVVEIDRTVLELARLEAAQTESLSDSGTREAATPRFKVGDGRAWIRRQTARYDAILLDLPGPENAGLNRFYTVEFFREARAALRPDGLLAFSLASSPNYLGPEQLALERSIVAAMRISFPVVEVLPGDRHLYFASSRPLDFDLEPVLAARGIVTRRLLDYDWDEYADPFRREELRRQLELDGGFVNRDLAPLAFQHLLDLRARVGQVDRRWIPLLAWLPLVVMGWAAGRRATRLVVGTSGFASMALQFGLLLAFQVLSGHLYLWIAFFVTLFLTGAALGAGIAPRLPGSTRARLSGSDLALIAAAVLLLLASREGATAGSPLREMIAFGFLPLLTLASALPVGVQFAVAGEDGARTEPSRTARLYLVDLAGAASGTITVGLWLLPRYGLTGLVLAVASMKLISLAALRIRRHT